MNKLTERTITMLTTKNKNQPSKSRGTFANSTHDMNLIDIDKHMPDINDLFKRTVIVTAFSENHLFEAKGMIASSQKHMPQNKIVVYDLGLTPATKAKVRWDVGLYGSLCYTRIGRPYIVEQYTWYRSGLCHSGVTNENGVYT